MAAGHAAVNHFVTAMDAPPSAPTEASGVYVPPVALAPISLAEGEALPRYAKLVPEVPLPTSSTSKMFSRAAARFETYASNHLAKHFALSRLRHERTALGLPPIPTRNRLIQDNITSRWSVFETTTPSTAEAIAYFERGADRELMALIKREARSLPVDVIPIFLEIARLAEELAPQHAKADWQKVIANLNYFAGAHSRMFRVENNQFGDVGLRRGLADCEQHLFIPVSDYGMFGPKKETTAPRLTQMITRLPKDAVFADFGGGYGLMAFEAAALRPDLEIFVNDLQSPEAWYESTTHRTGLPMPQDMHEKITYLTGDARTTEIPGAKKAALITAVSLSQYIPDALDLVAHLYNQLEVNGIVMVTLASNVSNINKEHGPQNRISREIVRELAALGVRAEIHNDARTLVIERADQRRMVKKAALAKSPTVHVVLSTIGEQTPIMYHTALYSASGEPNQNWVGLK